MGRGGGRVVSALDFHSDIARSILTHR